VAALYFSFSRGAIAAFAVGLVLYVALARSRGLVFTALAAAVPLAATLWAAWSADLLASASYFRGDGPAQGHRVALVLIAAVLVAAGSRAALSGLERRWLAAPPWLSRQSAVRLVVAGLVVVVAAGVTLGAPGKIADQAHTFATGEFAPDTGDARDRLTSVRSSGRPALWETAFDAFRAEPVHGSGAATFALLWQRRPDSWFAVTDGHSLYTETLGELGFVGAVLLLVLLLTPVAIALRRLGGSERHAYAAFAAAGAMLLVHAAIDWDWEMPALFAWYFGTAGVVLARRTEAVVTTVDGDAPRVRRVVAGLGCLVLAVTPALVAESESRLDAAAAAFARRDCPAAVDSALGALDVLQRAAAHEIIGYCDLRSRQNGLALRAMAAAHRADPDNWRYLYGLAVAQALSGRDPRAAADAALRRNPHEELARSLARAMRSPSVRKRYRAAARARIPAG
jgi:hypothetical protein